MPARHLQDSQLKDTVSLPGGNETVYSKDFDLGAGEKFEDCELLVEIPALTLLELPDTKTITVKAFHGDSAEPTTELATLGAVTGATGTNPSLAKVLRFRFPSVTKRFLRVGFVGVATVDADAKEASVAFVF